MSDYDPDYYSEGDFDDKEDLLWSEKDWQHYLLQNRRLVLNFAKLYRDLKAQRELLSDISKVKTDDSAYFAEIAESLLPEDYVEDADDEPYTFHKSPLYIVTTALYLNMRQIWEQLITKQPYSVSSAFSWNLAKSLHSGEKNAILAAQALEHIDYSLAICHLKVVLRCIQETFFILDQLPTMGDPVIIRVKSGLKEDLTDLQAYWLEALEDCQDSINMFRQDED